MIKLLEDILGITRRKEYAEVKARYEAQLAQEAEDLKWLTQPGKRVLENNCKLNNALCVQVTTYEDGKLQSILYDFQRELIKE